MVWDYLAADDPEISQIIGRVLVAENSHGMMVKYACLVQGSCVAYHLTPDSVPVYGNHEVLRGAVFKFTEAYNETGQGQRSKRLPLPWGPGDVV